MADLKAWAMQLHTAICAEVFSKCYTVHRFKLKFRVGSLRAPSQVTAENVNAITTDKMSQNELSFHNICKLINKKKESFKGTLLHFPFSFSFILFYFFTFLSILRIKKNMLSFDGRCLAVL